MSFRACGRSCPATPTSRRRRASPCRGASSARGDLITYGGPACADHVAFWLGDGRILHATQREGADGVVEEPEPAELHARRRASVRFAAARFGSSN